MVQTWIYSGQVTEPDWGVVSSTTTALVIFLLIKPTLFSAQMLMILGFPLEKKRKKINTNLKKHFKRKYHLSA